MTTIIDANIIRLKSQKKNDDKELERAEENIILAKSFLTRALIEFDRAYGKSIFTNTALAAATTAKASLE